MAYEISVPSPGESINEVTIDEWFKEDGEAVEQDEVIGSLLSDKAAVEIYAEEEGVLRILVPAGETVEVDSVIGRIEEGSGNGAAGKKAQESEAGGSAAQAAEATAPSADAPQPAGESTYATGTAAPAAQKLIEENGIDPAKVRATGKDGRITKADVLAYLESGSQPEAQAGPSEAKTAPSKQEQPPKEQPQPAATNGRSASAQAPAAKDAEAKPGERREKMTPLRQTLAKRLVGVKNETAMLTTFNEVDMSAVLELRKRHKESFQDKHGIKLGFMGFFAKACCLALREFPDVNAYIDGSEAVYHDYVDLGIAVSTERGLVVPIVRNAESMSLAEIELGVHDLASKARENKITIPEMTGGTFTITNGGVFGSLLSTPILNPPQSAILGMHRMEDRPVARNGEVVIRPMMYLALSYDHRIVDGKESVSFLKRVVDYLQDPERMIVGI